MRLKGYHGEGKCEFGARAISRFCDDSLQGPQSKGLVPLTPFKTRDGCAQSLARAPGGERGGFGRLFA